MKRSHFPYLLLWTVICAFTFLSLLIGKEQLPGGDFAGQFYAFSSFQAREIAAGRLPLWSPGSYAGFPFAADIQSAAFYPLRWLTIILTLPWGLSYYAFQVEGILHIWLAGLFIYFLAFDITKERLAALLSAIAFGLGGYLTSFPLLQLAILETITWLPIILLLQRRAFYSERPLPWLMSSAVLLGISALAGHPQTFLHIAYLVTAYFLFLAWQTGKRWQWTLGIGSIFMAVALGTAAVALLPALRFLPLTTRSETSLEFVASGLPLLHYAQLLVPGTLSLWVPEYVGMSTVFLFLYAWLSRRIQSREQFAEILFWSLIAFLSAWLALGGKGILFELAYRIAPGFSLFRQQERLLGLVSFSLALLAAQGLAIWLKTDAKSRHGIVQTIAILIGIGLLLVGFILFMAEPIAAENWPILWLRQWVAFGVVTFLLWANWKRQVQGLALVILLAFDLGLFIHGPMNLQPATPDFWSRPAWLEFVETTEPTRIDTTGTIFANVGEIYGLEDLHGISPLKPEYVEQFGRLPKLRRWQLLNVSHILAWGKPSENLTPIMVGESSIYPGQTMEAALYRYEDALPRAWMVYDIVPAPDETSAYEHLKDSNFDPTTQVVLHQAVEGLEEITSPAKPPKVDVNRLSSNSLEISVTTETPGILVISEWAYPGWQAEIDGEQSPLFTADYALQGLFLPAGESTVNLRYVPPDVFIGGTVTLLALFFATFLSWRWQPETMPRQESGRMLPAIPIQINASRGVINSFTRPLTRLRISGRWPILMILIVLLGFGLRVISLSHQELRGDEAFSYLYARNPAAEIIPALIREGDPHSPFHYLLLHGWMQLAGRSEVALRFISLIAGVLVLPLLYQLGKSLWDERLGVLTALLAALSQSLVWISQDVRNQYTLTILFATLATLILFAISPPRERQHRESTVPKSLLWLLYAVVSAKTVYSHYYGLFALFGHGLFLVTTPSRRKLLWPWLASGLVAALLFAPWPLSIGKQLLAAGQLSDPDTPELANYLKIVGLESLGGPAFNIPIGQWLLLGAGALCAYGFYTMWLHNRGTAFLMLGWLASAVLTIYLVRFRRSTFNPFYITVAAPAWWTLISAGLLALWQRKDWYRLLGPLSLLSAIVIAGISLRNYYTEPAYQRLNGYRGVAEQIETSIGQNDVFVANFPDPSLVYYLEDISIPYVMQPSSPRSTADETQNALAELAQTYDRLWFVPAYNSVWDPENVAFRWLDYHNLHEQQSRHQELDLMAYRPLHAVDQVIAPLNLQLDNQTKLEGFYLTVDGEPVIVDEAVVAQPGSKIDVTLLWVTNQAIPEDYTVFVHLLDENGNLLAQHDGIPIVGTRPTSSWGKGERLLDLHTLELPHAISETTGHIVVGMYQSDTIERQLFADGRDAMPLANIRIER